MQMEKIKPLFEAFVRAYDQEASKKIWATPRLWRGRFCEVSVSERSPEYPRRNVFASPE